MPKPRDFTTSEIAELIGDVRDAPCRSSYEQGCRCPIHGDGSHAPKVKLSRIGVAAEVTELERCTGTMTCMCARCCEQRKALISARRRPAPRQPWEVTPLARAA